MLGTKLRLQPELDVEMVSVFLMQMPGSNLDAAQACRRAAAHAGLGWAPTLGPVLEDRGHV